MPKWRPKKKQPKIQAKTRKTLFDGRPPTGTQLAYLHRLARLGVATEGQWARFSGVSSSSIFQFRQRLEAKRLIGVAHGYPRDGGPRTRAPGSPTLLHVLTEAGMRQLQAFGLWGPCEIPILRRWARRPKIVNNVGYNILLTEALMAVLRSMEGLELMAVLRRDSTLAGCRQPAPEDLTPNLTVKFKGEKENSTLSVLVEIEGASFSVAQKSQVEQRIAHCAKVLNGLSGGANRAVLLYLKRFGDRTVDPKVTMKKSSLENDCVIASARDLHRIDSIPGLWCTLIGESSRKK